MIEATAKLNMIKVQPMPCIMRVFGADLKLMASEMIRIITEPVQKLIVIYLTALGMIQSNLSQKL